MSKLEPTRTYSNHTATDIVRRMLDERGVEWTVPDESWNQDSITYWKVGNIKWVAFESENDTLWLNCNSVTDLTPEQAIAATLGSCNVGRYVGLRRGEYWERTENGDYYCGGCGWKVTDHDSYCPECGGALHEYALGTGTCNADETDTWECVRDDLGGYGKTMTVHVMECTECGHTYEHVNGDYEFCPRCGRKREDVSE